MLLLLCSKKTEILQIAISLIDSCILSFFQAWYEYNNVDLIVKLYLIKKQ